MVLFEEAAISVFSARRRLPRSGSRAVENVLSQSLASPVLDFLDGRRLQAILISRDAPATASRQSVATNGEGIVSTPGTTSMRPALPEHLPRSGQRMRDESVNHDPPIFGSESPATSLPMFLVITENDTQETRDATAPGRSSADAEG